MGLNLSPFLNTYFYYSVISLYAEIFFILLDSKQLNTTTKIVTIISEIGTNDNLTIKSAFLTPNQANTISNTLLTPKYPIVPPKVAAINVTGINDRDS